MKPLLAILMFAAIGCFANQTNNVTSKVHERKDKDGKVIGSYEEFFRGKDKIMMTTSFPDSQGQIDIRSRSYFLHGEMMMTELAVRRDDKPDTILVYHPGTEDIEVFRRKSDGSVNPASTELALAFASQRAALTKLGPDAWSDPTNHVVLEELEKKIQAALDTSNEMK
jgi:hypothetical protein